MSKYIQELKKELKEAKNNKDKTPFDIRLLEGIIKEHERLNIAK